MKYNKKDIEIISKIWDGTDEEMKCPECKGKLILIQIEPISDYENIYTAYDTIVECSSCPFKVKATSFSILGSIKDFDAHNVEVAGWSPTGSRVLSKYKHLLDYELLKNLKKSGELIEILVVNDQAVQVIG